MKKYNIYTENHELEHTAYVQDDTQNVLLRYSDNPPWVERIRGKKTALLKNTGNGIEILMKDKTISLDYSEFIYLKHLMHLHILTSSMIKSYYGDYKYEEVKEEPCVCKCKGCKK